jgi:phosphomannomutase
MPAPDDLRARAERWADDDPDPSTQAELRTLLQAPDLAATDLADRFDGSLAFGTAGLRGVLGPGANRMNRAVVLRTSWGLARHLLEAVPDAGARGVVVGYDGRRYSRQFAMDTALVLAALGVRALLFTGMQPTPMIAFAVQALGAAAGVMVTASHNPPEYNGYKVYWGNGAQIIPPTDAKIAARIAEAPPARDVPRLSEAEALARGLLVLVGAEMEDRYLAAIGALPARFGDAGARDRSLGIVYTPLHGVGDALARRALATAGFTQVTSVPAQREPDGTFPTVAFPNPEEKGAMDLSFALARELAADLVLANDPDADRLAVAVPAPRDAGSATGYVQLTGNHVGILLGHHVLTARADEERAPKPRLVVASIVSSPMLGVIAGQLGVRYEETLTGFKWITNRAMDLEREGYLFVFGYEEALGYAVGDVVRDKDGISAAVMIADMASGLRARGLTLLDELDAIHRRFGLFVSTQVNLTRKGASGAGEIARLMDRLRAAKPSKVGALAVVAICDYEAQSRTLASGSIQALALPKSNVLSFELEGGSRIIARPSGTEPKVKFYFDVREPMVPTDSSQDASARAHGAMAALVRAFMILASDVAADGAE